MSSDPVDVEALIAELDRISEQWCGDADEDDEISPRHLWRHPAYAASCMLYDDAVAVRELPDDVVTRLWQIALELGSDPREVLSDDTLAKARLGRRSRPTIPPRLPLKGGGHGAGRGQGGKTEWPARWSDDKAMDLVMEVAREPTGAVQQPDGTFRAWGTQDGVEVRVIVTADGEVVTAYPVRGAGVRVNPLEPEREPYVRRLEALVRSTDLDPVAHEGVAEQLAVGEWDQVLRTLSAVGVPPQDSAELAALTAAAGIRTPG